MNSEADNAGGRAEPWREETARLRDILVACGMTEERKWGKPCFTHDGRNIAIIQGMKSFLALMFFKGALLTDPEGVLEVQGPNSRSARRVRFTSIADVDAKASAVRSLVNEALAVEKAGLAVAKAPAPDLPQELLDRMEQDPALKAAFTALTPGRQRGYCLDIARAKRPATRAARIDKHRPRILDGKGLHDR